jgi:hypothetical protein
VQPFIPDAVSLTEDELDWVWHPWHPTNDVEEWSVRELVVEEVPLEVLRELLPSFADCELPSVPLLPHALSSAKGAAAAQESISRPIDSVFPIALPPPTFCGPPPEARHTQRTCHP